jgi:hypothetical protein
MTYKFGKKFVQCVIELVGRLKERDMAGANESLTLLPPKILEGNAIEIVEKLRTLIGLAGNCA